MMLLSKRSSVSILLLLVIILPLSACAQDTMQTALQIPSKTSMTPSEIESEIANEEGNRTEEAVQLEPKNYDSLIFSALQVGKIDNIRFEDTSGLITFYEQSNFRPVWASGTFNKTGIIKDILPVLENSWTHGLNPDQYHIKTIRQHLETANSGDDYEALDLIVSDALARYGRDMSGMRVNPSVIGQRGEYWRKPLSAKAVLTYIEEAQNKVDALENLAPRGTLYKTLQQELTRLYKEEADHKKREPLKISHNLKPGEKDEAILPLRRRMGFETDPANPAHFTYDDELAASVMAFQRAHGVAQDGIVGPQTVALMNLSNEQKLKQVLANLERLRWITQNKPDRYVMVNVPSATLWAMENGQTVMEMPVVVGRQDRPTNIFTTEISGIRFNPTWTVPPTIKKDDYLPKLRKNPYYLSDRGIEIKEGSRTIDPGTINWKKKDWAEVNAMRMVQGSSASNPLGRVRVLMDNPFNIYLHDTPSKSYFQKADRALSSGCVRMERPVEFADFILKDKADWSQTKRDEILKSGKMKEIYIANKVPVYIMYQTVWMAENDRLIYGADLYQHDEKLIAELEKIGDIPPI